jgi:hypothetical protein
MVTLFLIYSEPYNPQQTDSSLLRGPEANMYELLWWFISLQSVNYNGYDTAVYVI